MEGQVTVTIANWAGVNTGDDAIFSALLSSIRELVDPQARIFVVADNEREIRRRYDVDDTASIFEFYLSPHRSKVVKFLRESDLLIFGGGDLISGELTSMSLLALAKGFGVPVMCCGVGVVPIASPFRKKVTRAVLDRIDLITVRDRDSAVRLAELGVRTDLVKETADLAFLLSPTRSMEQSCLLEAVVRPITIGLNVRSQDEMYSFYALWSEDICIDTFAEVCDRLICDHGARILFIPMEHEVRAKPYHGQVFDDALARRIGERMRRPDRFSILDEELSPQELKGLLGKVDVLLSMRLHALIIASDLGIPLIAFNYAPKIRSFMSQIGRNHYVIDVESITPEVILAAVEQALREGRLESSASISDLHQRSRENIELVQMLLQEGRRRRPRPLRSAMAVTAIVAVNLAGDMIYRLMGRSLGRRSAVTFPKYRPVPPIDTPEDQS